MLGILKKIKIEWRDFVSKEAKLRDLEQKMRLEQNRNRELESANIELFARTISMASAYNQLRSLQK